MDVVLRVEFHCHTSSSKDCLLPPQTLIRCCQQKGIDRVVITDHNTIAGAVAARAADPLHVIVGEEIMSSRGEILAAFVTAEVPPGLSPEETIARLRAQDAFITVAHPFDHSRKGGWQESDLLQIIDQVDAIEVFNSRCMLPASNRLAAEFARLHDLAETVGSDAHTCWELGRSTLLLPEFGSALQLRRVIRQGRPQTHWSLPWIHLTSRYAKLRKRIKVGLDMP